MRSLRRILGWLIARVPTRYPGSALDRFGPEEQQDIIAHRYRSGM